MKASMSYCAMVRMATRGHARKSGPDPIRCPGARRALGLTPPHVVIAICDPNQAMRLVQGYISQIDTLLPWLTVRGNVEIGLELRRVSDQEKKSVSDRLIHQVGLGGFENSYPFELSGGMKKRAAVIRTLAYDPDIIFMDEPFVGLDVHTRDELEEDILKIWQDHRKTIVLVTHDLTEAITLSDRVVLLTARPAAVKSEYAVSLPRPRSVAEIRFSEAFITLHRQIWQDLSAEATRSEGWLPVYLAKELGFFREEGLDPELVTYKDGPLALMGLLNEDAQFCIIGFEPVLMAFEKGQSSKVILTTLNSQPYMFVGRPGIKSITEMKGKAVFGGMPGSAPYFFVKTAVRNAGLNPDKDVTFASMEYGAEIVAMTMGDIDGVYVRATRYAQILEAGGNILVDATDPVQHKKIYGSERYEAMNVQVTDKYVKEHPEIIQAFSNAVYKAMLWQSRHSDEEVALAVSPSFPGRKIDAALIKVLRKCLSPDGGFTEEGYRSIVDFCLANGVIKKDVPMADAIDPSFMKKAKASIQ